MADGRRRSVDIPISRTLVALRRVRSLRDPSTNSMSKFSALFDSPNWESSSANGISLRFRNTCPGLGLGHSLVVKETGCSDQVEEPAKNIDFYHNSRGSNFMSAPNADINLVGDTAPSMRIKEVERSGLRVSDKLAVDEIKISSEIYCSKHREDELNLKCVTPSGSHMEDMDSCNGPIMESLQEEKKDYSGSKLMTQSKNRINSYQEAGDMVSCVGSPRLLLNDAIFEGTSPNTSSLLNREADVDCDHRGCGISCIWSRTPRLRESNCPSDLEYEDHPLLSGDLSEVIPCSQRGSRKQNKEIISSTESPRSLSQKFRPKFFHDLVGQGVVARSLLSSIANRNIASFYLFDGPRGTGKTSASKILAAALNCLSHEESKPCGVCRECVLFYSGNNRDILVVDSVRINQRDRVKSLIKHAVSLPVSSLFKVFIIDECQLLRREAWATILNSLDNLPRHVVFIMITNDLDKLPRSAVSQSQRYHFPKIKDAEISSKLKKICIEEGLHFDKVALDFIAAKSSGSLRDAEMLLDQLSLLGKRITISLAYELIGIVSDDELVDLLELALSSDTSNTVRKAREMMRSRIDPVQLTSQLANLVMDVLAGKCEGITEARKKFLLRHATEADKHRLSHAIKILSETEKQLRMSKNQTTWLTAALLQLGTMESTFLDPNDLTMPQRTGPLRDDFCSTSSTEKSLNYLIPCACDNKSDKSDATYCRGKLEAIWMRATELCQYKSLRKFLRKNGKLSSLCIQQGVVVAELEFQHPKYASKAEKSWKLIASSLQSILGCNVEIRINLVPCASVKKIGKATFNPFSCSRRMQHKSHSTTGHGSPHSDSSDMTSEKAMIGEKSIGSCSFDCGPLVPHICYGTRGTTTIRDSRGNALSTGWTTTSKSLQDGMPKEPGEGTDSSNDKGSDQVSKCLSVQEPDSQPHCFFRAVRFRRKLPSSNTFQLICLPKDNNPLAIQKKTSHIICGKDPYIFCSGSLNCGNCLPEEDGARKSSNMHCWKAPSSLKKLRHKQRSNLAGWVLPCAS